VVKGRGRRKEDTEKKMVGKGRGVEKRDGGKSRGEVGEKNGVQREGSGEQGLWAERAKGGEKKWWAMGGEWREKIVGRREENVMRKNGSQGEGTVERREGGKKRVTKGVRRDGGQREGILRKGMVGRRE
jgi:hypothetical protein